MMTDKQLVMFQFFMLSSLVVLGSSESSVVSQPAPSSLDLIEEDEGVPTNMSSKPILKPKESSPTVGKYVLKNQQGKVCIRASLGVVFTVTENKKKSYFNLDPKSTSTTGYCGDQKAALSLTFDGGDLEFTFVKDGRISYVKNLHAALEPAPPCKNCKSKTYTGTVDHGKLFPVAIGKSFKCTSKTSFIMSENLKIKIVTFQTQAFELPNGAFGKEVECWADYTTRILPIVLGAVAVGVILIAVLVYVLCRERRGQGYEQL